MEMTKNCVTHQEAEATTPKMTPSLQSLLTTAVRWASTADKRWFSVSCFHVFRPQLCVHRPARMGADASGPTGVTAVQDGADTTAPGDLTHTHTRCFKHPLFSLIVFFPRWKMLFSALKVSFILLLALFCSQEEEVSVLSLLKGRLSAPCESSYEGNSCIVARNICKPLHFHLSAGGKARTIL